MSDLHYKILIKMETIEMKRLIACLLVLTAVFSLSAALTFTGGFGYEMTIPTDGSAIYTTGYDDNAGLGAGLYLNATGDFFKVTYYGGFDYYTQTAVGYLYLDKALATIDIELPVTLTLQSGNSQVSAQNVYANPNGNYAGLIRIDNSANLPLGLTMGYGSTFTGLVGYSYADSPATLAAQVQNYLVSAKIAPVDGISATVSWTNHDQFSQSSGFTATQQAVTAVTGKVEFSKLVEDLPVDVTVSAAASIFDWAAITTSYGAVTVGLGMDDIAADFEYQYDQGTSGIAMNASYAGIENVGLSAGLGSADVTDFATDLWYYAQVDYTLSGTTYFAKISDAGIGFGFDLSF
jgi:hypothetical protein